MTASAQGLAGSGFRVVRFEFGYMASRRTSAGRKPPPRAEKLIPEYIAAIDALEREGPLIIGGKSMGGRVASMVADELHRLRPDRGPALPRLSVPPAGKPDAVAHGASRRAENPDAHRAGNARPVRHAGGGRGYTLSKSHRDSLAGRRRPRSQAAQERVGLFGGRSSEDDGRNGCRVDGQGHPIKRRSFTSCCR